MRRDQRGQILPLFALMLVALFALAALLFDAAQAMAVRRQLQDAGDAAALAGANVIQTGTPRGCSATAGPPPGSPRAVVTTAVQASITTNLPSYPPGSITISCPAGWENQAVRVQLTRTAPSFFRSVVGAGPLVVNTASTAVNGPTAGVGYSVLTLNPYNPTWSSGLRGCPSMRFNGSPNVTSLGSMHINSACRPGSMSDYAVARSGNASTVTLLNGSVIEIVGRADPGAMTIIPAPIENSIYLADPLRFIADVNQAVLPIRSTSRLVLSNQNRTLDPGIYVGGIELRNRSRIYLHPGIYVLQGGGIDVGAQAEVYTVGPTVSSTTQGNWATDCPNNGTCGVMFYNYAAAGVMGQYNVTAGAVFLARGLQPGYSGLAANPDYKGLLLWQHRLPVPTSITVQPMVRMQGGGSVKISGTIYAPSAPVELNGGAGGGGGFDIDYTLQFIVWDLIFSGTSTWRLDYSDLTFVQLPDYGLVE
jgi:Flp pilus assembly protein TadG